MRDIRSAAIRLAERVRELGDDGVPHAIEWVMAHGNDALVEACLRASTGQMAVVERLAAPIKPKPAAKAVSASRTAISNTLTLSGASSEEPEDEDVEEVIDVAESKPAAKRKSADKPKKVGPPMLMGVIDTVTAANGIVMLGMRASDVSGSPVPTGFGLCLPSMTSLPKGVAAQLHDPGYPGVKVLLPPPFRGPLPHGIDDLKCLMVPACVAEEDAFEYAVGQLTQLGVPYGCVLGMLRGRDGDESWRAATWAMRSLAAAAGHCLAGNDDQVKLFLDGALATMRWR